MVCSPLSIVTNGVGKKPLGVNLQYVNGFLWKQKFKYEDLRVAMSKVSGCVHLILIQNITMLMWPSTIVKYLGVEWRRGFTHF